MSRPVENGMSSLTLGIVGGAGPMASVLLYKKIIENCQTKYNCKADADFPKIWIVNYPFSPMLEEADSDKNRPKLVAELEDALMSLTCLSAKRIGIACNTIHF